MRTCTLILAATVAAAAFVGMCCRPAQAVTLIPPPKTTVSGTCEAAHEAYRSVNATFCTARLSKEPSAIDADTRGLARAGASAGVRNADAALSEVETALRRRDGGDEQEDGPLYRSMLERCGMLFGIISEKYATAREAIAEQRYDDVQRELSGVPSLGHACSAGLTLARRGAASPPFVQFSEDNTQIVLLTLAITSLSK